MLLLSHFPPVVRRMTWRQAQTPSSSLLVSLGVCPEEAALLLLRGDSTLNVIYSWKSVLYLLLGLNERPPFSQVGVSNSSLPSQAQVQLTTHLLLHVTLAVNDRPRDFTVFAGEQADFTLVRERVWLLISDGKITHEAS
jgi:hypothetical protein